MTIALLTGEPAINYLISDLKSLTFPIPFPWLGDHRNLDIFWKPAAQSTLFLLVDNVDYSLFGQSMSYDQVLRQESFGSLSLIQPSPPKFSVGDSITIRRYTAVDQKTHFVADKLISSNVERSLDKLTIALQDAQFLQDTLHVPPNEIPSREDFELPPAAIRSNKLLIFDPSGRPSVIPPDSVGNPRAITLSDSTTPTPGNTVLDPTGKDGKIPSSSGNSWNWVDPPVIPDVSHKLTLSGTTIPTTGNTVLDPTGQDGKIPSSSGGSWNWLDPPVIPDVSHKLTLSGTTIPTTGNTVLDPTGKDGKLVSSSSSSWNWVDPPVIPDVSHKLTLSGTTTPTPGNTVLDPTGHDGKIPSSSGGSWNWLDLDERISSAIDSTSLNYGSQVATSLTSLPTDPSARATKLLGWNSEGSALQLYSQGGGQGAGSPFKVLFFSHRSTLDTSNLPDGAGTSMSLALPLTAIPDLYFYLPKFLDDKPHVSFIFDEDVPHDPLEYTINIYGLLYPEKIQSASIITNGPYIFTCYNPYSAPVSISLNSLQILAPKAVLNLAPNNEEGYHLQIKLGEEASYYLHSTIHVSAFEISSVAVEIIAFHNVAILVEESFTFSDNPLFQQSYSLLINFRFKYEQFLRFSLKSPVLFFNSMDGAGIHDIIRFSGSNEELSSVYYAHISIDCSRIFLYLKSNFLSFDSTLLARNNLVVSFSFKSDNFIAKTTDSSLFPVLFLYPPLSSSFSFSHSAQIDGCSFAQFFYSPSFQGTVSLNFDQLRYSLAPSASSDFALFSIPSNFQLFGHIHKLIWHSNYSSPSTGKNVLFLQSSPEGTIAEERSGIDCLIEHLLLSWESPSDFAGSSSQVLLWQRFNVPENILLHIHCLEAASQKISFSFINGSSGSVSPSVSCTHILIDYFSIVQDGSTSFYSTRYASNLIEANLSNSFFLTIHALYNYRGITGQSGPVFGFDITNTRVIPVFTLGFALGGTFDIYSQINLSNPNSSSLRYLVASYMYQTMGWLGPLEEDSTTDNKDTPAEGEAPAEENSSPSPENLS
jgi:hypothetical protein